MGWIGPSAIVAMLLMVCASIVADVFRGKGPLRKRVENLGAIPFVLAGACLAAWPALSSWTLDHPGVHVRESTTMAVREHGAEVLVDSRLYALSTEFPILALWFLAAGVIVLVLLNVFDRLRTNRPGRISSP